MTKDKRILFGILCVSLISLFFFTTQSKRIFKSSHHDSKVTYSRLGCIIPPDPCPVYAVTIDGDGTVVFRGEYYVNNIGEVTYQIPPDDVARLFDEFEKAQFFSLNDAYIVEGEIIKSSTVILETNDRRKKILHVGAGCGFSDPYLDNAPGSLCQIEALIDEITLTDEYINGKR